MTKEKNTDPYEFLKTRVQKTQDSSPTIDELKEEVKSLNDDWNVCDTAYDELELENRKLKKLLKESIENFKTKELADRIYNIPGIERPDPEPIKVKEDEEIPY